MRRNQFDLLQMEEFASICGGGAAAGTTAGRALRELCHDLIVPAATIRMLAEAAHQQEPPSREAGGHLALISAEASRIAAICSHVLGRARPKDPVRLDALAAQQIRSLHAMYATTLECNAEPVMADIHPAVFTRVLGNLLANACQAAGPEGLARISITAVDEHARVCVEDSGPGLTAPRYGQTSYGLQIVWSLVLDCQGSVQMGVSDLGGLRVVVAFPLRPAGPAS